MAESPFKGLLYSPEVLGGIGLLTAGLSGQNPSAGSTKFNSRHENSIYVFCYGTRGRKKKINKRLC